ncbi:L-cysteine:1D-myo-inositol 2-amino-2-deoxy-alpha-D-glucopyranoside ligase [Nakamurella panacisegetis]|uniref:L-cysteine:1D-myo-inositol 2-amino-2-deoxy-alpha-D-glucopyranoside ligase n=1 Tax=Nakamurella panacisegetis TaxID=1090615 RepID=A0A1H0S1P8_9ACTN|nr:cysteine--1-D-myo-inosityl 2-amino-2-deoxy-alpha-D-glucopyranoside ligase [Nakamurella panacisegetis]SDP35547.1 L-cysteine:1D-myo-inositol 2-amino-2-deoxy-alpha-D-glucopyranoside ligase [Nakamurella panacisegetis]
MRSWPTPPVPSLPRATGGAASGDILSLYDSSTGTVRATRPGPVATIYVCGITPYDSTHLGHAATYLTFDLVQRMWLDAGHRVHYVQNITDIDDPLLERAERDGIDWEDLAAEQIELFRQDMTALRVLPPTDYIGAVEAMDEVSAAVAALLDSGAAYRVADDEFPDVYFDIEASGRFGYESRYDETTMNRFFAERGGDPGRAGKKHELDPLLWRMARPGEPSWESPLGAGRAGWHIECAAIAGNRLGVLTHGATIDVQGGGSDLIFPHHECSAAHAEVLAGVDRFAQHYTHAGMIGLDGEKMSKSRGNLVFVSKLRADGVDPRAIRLALFAGHYRQDRFWDDGLLTTATERLAAWSSAAVRVGAPATTVVADLRAALADDLDTPAALAALDVWAADGSLDGALVATAVDALLGVDLV